MAKRYPYLTPVLGGPGAPRYPVTAEEQQIGRSERSDISLLEPTISRRHASIRLKSNGTLRLKDLGSKHGTFVNSRRVTAADLRVGDIVVFGLSLVLRVEESSEPVPRPENPAMAMDSPTLIDPLEQLTTTAIREPRGVTDSSPGMAALTGKETSGDRPLDVAAMCTALVPEAHVRLSELRADLKRMVDHGVDETDPYPILASVESVLATMNRLMAAVGSGEEVVPRVEPLRTVVREVINRLAPQFAKRRVRFMADVGGEYRVQCDTQRLGGALALLLRNAARAAPDGSPVEIMATGAPRSVKLAISHIGREYPADVLARSRDRGSSEPLLRDMGEVQQLVHTIGGSITVESRPGIGSTVRLALPVPAKP